MEVDIIEAGRRITEIIKQLDVGENGRRLKGEPLLDADNLMTDPNFQRALMLVPVLFEPSGRKGHCSYALKHYIERWTGTSYVTNAQATVAFAYHGFEIMRGRDSINYNVKCRAIDFNMNTDPFVLSTIGRRIQEIHTKFTNPYERADYSIFNQVVPSMKILRLNGKLTSSSPS
jgi:hypothetical protein